jgi:2-dehydropantoate 2-reductase
MHVIVYGAGAVGSAVGGLVALHDIDVVLVCRKEHAGEIRSQGGLRMRSITGEYYAPVTAVSSIRDVTCKPDSCILFTPKSNDTESCLKQLSGNVPGDIPVIGLQNGVSNEETIAASFSTVYAGVVQMTCSFLHPGQVTFRKIGRVILGKYPKGTDPFIKSLSKTLATAGFESTVSRSIMCDKWLKLVVNLQSTFHAIIEARDHDSIEFMKLKVGIVEEARKVLKADKIKAKSCDGRDHSLDDMIRELTKPKAQKSTSMLKVCNSTWQNLYLKRPEIENRFFHRPVIELGEKYGIPVPFNVVALEQVTRCHAKKLGPEALRAADVLAEIEQRIRKQ